MLNTILVKERLAAPMSFGMDDDYAEIMKMFGQVRYVNFAVALDTNRVIVANFNLKDEKVDKNIQFQKTYNYVGNQLIITLPIIHTKSDGNVENYGLLVVHISDFEIRYRILNFVKTSIFVFFGILLITFILSYYIGKIIAKPIIRLALFTSEVSKKADYAQRINKTTNDEIGDLYDKVNNFLMMLERRDSQKEIILKQLRRSEVKFKFMADLLPQPVFETTTDRRFTFLNKAGIEMLGIKDDFKNYLLDDFFSDEKNNQAFSKIESFLSDDSIFKSEFLLTTKSETIIPVFFHAQKILEQKQVGSGIRGTIIDISNIKKAQTDREMLIVELEAKNAELERFTYTVSHDLKSPLITIKGFLGLLLKDAEKGDIERMNKDMQRISNAADKMQNLLEDLLELSRIGRIINPPEVIDMNALVRDVIELLNGKINETKASIKVEENLKPAFGDKHRISEVFQNLIENALKFYKVDTLPDITVGQELIDNIHYYYVKDEGVGVAQTYHTKIFQLFDKLDNKTEGTGVGLALIKRIIEVHGGSIRIESELGMGTKFIFNFGNKEKK